jgi:outer membrane protein assembly factor BamB
MNRPLILALACASATSGLLFAQARSAPDWTTQGFDAQRTSWMRVDPYISADNMAKFQFIWKLKVDNESRHGSSLTAPVALGNLMTFRGFKSLVFVGGSSNNVYAIDYDFGTMFWRTHHNYTAGAREYSGSPTCPGGMTLPLTRATPLTPPVQTAFFGFARAPRPAKGDIGEPGKGAPQLAEIAARLAARGNRGGGGGDTPASAAGTAAAVRAGGPARGAAAPARGTPPPAPAAGTTAQAGSGGRGPNFVFSVAADGLLRGIIPDTGDLALAPARFIPANATATGLIWTNGFVYAATSNTCGGAPTAVYAMDYNAENKRVTLWESDGATIGGLAVGEDGTVYVTTGSGGSQYANSIVALDGATLKVMRAYSTKSDPFITTPVVFTEGNRTYVAATTVTSVYVFDAASLATPIVRTQPQANVGFSGDGVSTWRDAAGTRWLLASGSGANIAYAFDGNTVTERWRRQLVNPRTPIIVNGVVFALASGNANSNAVLYVLEAATGKELWSSGTTITSSASAGMSAGTGQVYVVTADNTVYAFGIPLAIN